MKFWIFKSTYFEYQNFRIHIFEIMNVFFTMSNRLLSFDIFYDQLIFVIWVLWKSFVKMSFFNDKNFHFQKFLIKPKPKIGSNGFFIWVSQHSCVLEKNNVLWLPWFQITKNKKISKFLWQSLASNTLCDSFDCVLTFHSFWKGSTWLQCPHWPKRCLLWLKVWGMEDTWFFWMVFFLLKWPFWPSVESYI